MSAWILAAMLAASGPASPPGLELFTLIGSLPVEDDNERSASQRSGAESPDELMARASRISEKALRYIKDHQSAEGSFESGGSHLKVPIALTSLAALAFMANGSTPEKGLYHVQTSKAIRWLLNHCTLPTSSDSSPPDEVSDVVWGYFKSEVDANSKMHGQGMATLALAEAYGMFGIANPQLRQFRDQLKTCLVAAISCVENAQTQTGGWGYYPRDSFHEGSVTITQIQALRAARNCGLSVSLETIQDAVQYVRESQWLDGETHKNYGGFRYQKNDTKVSFALTAAAVSTLNATGQYDSVAIDKGIAYMNRTDPMATGRNESYPFYSRFYAAQAYYQYRNPDKFWRSWYPRLVDRLEKAQGDDGRISTSQQYGPVYATAFSALTLAIPFGYLPIFQR